MIQCLMMPTDTLMKIRQRQISALCFHFQVSELDSVNLPNACGSCLQNLNSLTKLPSPADVM